MAEQRRQPIQWHSPRDGGSDVLAAQLDFGMRLRVIEPARAVRTDQPSYLAWVDAFRRTHTSSESQPDVERAKRAAVQLAVRVAMDKQEEIKSRLEHASCDAMPPDVLQDDLETLNDLLVTLLDEHDRLSNA